MIGCWANVPKRPNGLSEKGTLKSSRSMTRGTGVDNNMQTTTDPTTMLGRHSRVQTSDGTICGKILAVGANGISIAVERQVVRIPSGDIHAIRALN